MKRTNLYVLFLLSIYLCFFVKPGQAQTLPDTVEGILQWVEDTFGEYELTDEPLPDVSTIYGHVVDHYGDPVTEADVYIQWDYLGVDLTKKVKEVIIKTDNQGNFVAKSPTDNQPFIKDISKKDYEFKKLGNPFFAANSLEQEKLIEASKETPITFYMRKMGKTTFLLQDGYSLYVEETEYFISYDIFLREHPKVDRDLSMLENPNLIDLVFDAAKTGSSYTLRFIAPTETGGVQVSDEMLYEAPADGYTPELTLSFQAGDEMTKYLYFKSRNPVVYTRLTMEFRATSERLAFHYTNATNPYGSRNLEYEPDLSFDLRNQLRIEATEALKNGKLAAPEPNF